MLNEKIEKFNEIADSKGLFFVWQSIGLGVTSITSLVQLRLHHTGKLCLEIIPALLLLEEMGYITIEGDNIQVISVFDNYNDEEDFIAYFPEVLVDYLLNEEVISLEALKYNSQKDSFFLTRNGIKYKHASYRNLLLSFGILKKRDEITDIKEKSKIIFDKIKKLDIFEKSENIMVFASFGSEVDTYDFIKYCIHIGKTVSIPYVQDVKNSIMIATKIKNIDDLIVGYKGIREMPKDKIVQIDKKDIDMIITPCVCYDYQKYRVGYGKGFYDRFFDNISPYKLGICFDECIVEKIDINDYDVAVDMVITDKRVFI